MTNTMGNQQNNTQIAYYGDIKQKMADELITTPEKREDAVFYLTKGFVRLVNCNNGVTKVIGPGEVFGDHSVFFSKNIYAEALTSIDYIKIDESKLKSLMVQSPNIAIEITTKLSRQYIYLTNKPNIVSLAKELFSYSKKGYSVKAILANRNKKCLFCMN